MNRCTHLLGYVVGAFLVISLARDSATAQDYVKLKSLDRALKCYILEVGDSIIVFQKMNSSQILMALHHDLDWYYFEDGTGKNFSGKIPDQSDFDNAYEYRPPIPEGMEPDTADAAYDEAMIAKNAERSLPIEIMIRADPEHVFTVAVEEMLYAGFMIIQSNSDLLTLTTDYSSFDPSFMRGLLAGSFGIENFLMAISAMVRPIFPDSSKLILRGKVQFTQKPGIIEKVLDKALTGQASEYERMKLYLIRRGTKMAEPIEALALKIKERAENDDHQRSK